MTVGTGFLAVVAAAFAFQEAKGKEVVHTSQQPEYRVTIPAGYLSVPPRDAGFSFERSAGPEPWEKTRIDLVPLGLALDPKTPPPAAPFLRAVRLSEPREVKPVRLPWEELQIDGIECRWILEGVDQAARMAWIPTAGQATAVCISGPSTMADQLPGELLSLIASFKGRTTWLTGEEERSLRMARWPSYVPPALSGLFLLTWFLLFRGRPMRAHLVRLAWHASVPLASAWAYYFLARSAPAREKLGVEAPLILWFLVVGPLAIYHLLILSHRVRLAVDMGD